MLLEILITLIMLNRVDPKTKEDWASTVVDETAMVTCETGEVTGDEVVNRSTIENSVDPGTEGTPQMENPVQMKTKKIQVIKRKKRNPEKKTRNPEKKT